MPWISPAFSAPRRCELSLTFRTTTRFTRGFGPQESVLASRTTSWFGFHSTSLKAPVPTGCFPNSVPHFSTALGLAMSKTNIARLARNGACGSFSVMRTVCEPTASTLETIDLSSNPPNCASQNTKVWPSAEPTVSCRTTATRSVSIACRIGLDLPLRARRGETTRHDAPLSFAHSVCQIPSLRPASGERRRPPVETHGVLLYPVALPTRRWNMSGLKTIDRILRQAVESTAMPGVVAIAATGTEILYEGAFGRRELGGKAPMTIDTVVWIASMTKAITAAAAMQLVERGKLSLERPASEVVPELAAARVLEGFDAAGQPLLRPPKRSITLRHLLTHTAGFGYEIWDPAVARYQTVTGTPGVTTCTNAALTTPLMFDPGDRWEYGISIDWVGKMVEAAGGQKLDRYFQENIFGPLGMKDTSFRISPSQRERLASVHQRGADGALTPVPFEVQQDPEFLMGGGGLYGTAPDYLAFAYMIMQGGTFKGAQVLRPETVALMAQNHLGALDIGVLRSTAPTLSNDVELFPRMPKGWGLSFLINTQPAPTGRAAGSLAWAGLANTYFWIDRAKRVCGVFLSQVFPFYDRTAIDLFEKFETEVYRAL